ncbi:shikimate kinase [Gracilibacillus halotolerans]|uniref:Shikimate kinase n=1 Tax=Gracilibacillus halotolerans TaxID=74386 RepID=A0A841RIC4_9BACI|nr:shikimate kinase [Gracilibacillus halotolerans]MBB6511772.1 shikimate kinase [Gracilibacillus halotolerans]
MKSVFLVGFMGSGKTSIAKALQTKLSWKLQDTDDMIVQEYKQSIPEIFRERGEQVFRDYESSVLKKTNLEQTIVATGGGIIEREENRKFLKQQEMVIYLDTSWEEINQRLSDDETRPIWSNENTDKKELLKARISKYKEVADFIVKTDGKSVDEIANEIISFI